MAELSSFIRATEMPPLMELTARAARLQADGADVIRLDQGAVDLAPPRAFVDAVAVGLREAAIHGYTPDTGLPELLRALARYAAARLGVEGKPEEIAVTAGANQGCFAALMTILAPGAEVIVPSPWYFNHAMMVTAVGAVPVAVPLSGRFVPDPGEVAERITSRTRALILVNPNNPTGARYDDGVVRDITHLAVKNDLWLLCDQTYHEVHYGDRAPFSPAAIPAARERTITVCSFSKTIGVAGWRLGFVAAPPRFMPEMLKVQDSSVICACRASQHGLLAALPEIDDHMGNVLTTLRGRRDRLAAALRTNGLEAFAEPGGSLYLFLGLPGGADDIDASRRLLEQGHVAVVPGSVFGPGGEGHVRISFGSTPEDRLEEAARRMAAVLLPGGVMPSRSEADAGGGG